MQRVRNNSSRFISLLIIAILIINTIWFSLNTFAENTDYLGLGQVLYQEQFNIAPDVVFSKYVSNHPSLGIERAFSIEYKPGDNIKLISVTGDSVFKRYTLSQFISMNDNEDQKVIGGINGDYYEISNGMTYGPIVHNGSLIASCYDYYPSIGFNEDGTAYMGALRMKIMADINNKEDSIRINHLNKNLGAMGIYMYTKDFAANTSETVNSYSVIADITEGELAIGKQLKVKVVSIVENSRNNPLKEGQIIIAAALKDENIDYLGQVKKLKLGDSLNITVEDLSEENSQWQNAKEVIGGGEIILQDGEITTEDDSIHPRTVVGIKSDGTIIMFVVDGRQSNYSTGMNLMDIASYLKKQGCVDALNLDGGGSATLAARMPGDYNASIINKPSDGNERKNTNALLLVMDKTAVGPAVHIHNKPVKVLMLPGAQLPISVTATDEAYQPAQLEGALKWSVTNNIGTVDNGTFKSEQQNGSGTVISKLGDITGETQVILTNDVQLKLNKSALSLNPGETYDFSVTAVQNTIPVICQDTQFKWSVEGNIGIIDENGFFTAADGDNLFGRIIATYKNIELSADMAVGRLPIILEDFEDGVGDWISAGARLPENGISLSDETSMDMVLFGKHAMKLNYNMLGGEMGTAGAYAVKDIEIEGYPTAIGMWVYGDNSGHWLRAEMKDGSNEVFSINLTSESTGVNWIGWKYVEAPVPKGKKLPLALSKAVRYMETIESKKSAGTIYIDNIRAVYGYKNDDLTPPKVIAIYPAADTVLTEYTNIRIKISDNTDRTGSGIDTDKIRLYIDDILASDMIYNENDSSVQWNTNNLTKGEHKFTLKFRDYFGNECVKEWYYIWDPDADKTYYKPVDISEHIANKKNIYKNITLPASDIR